MRKIIGAAVSCLVACSLFLTVQPAFGASVGVPVDADMDTAWVPREINVSTFQWVSVDGTYSFGIFDFGNEANEALLATSSLSGSPFVIGETYYTSLEFSAMEDSLVSVAITTYHDTIDSSAPGGVVHNIVQSSNIDLTDSNEFGFFFSNYTDGTKDDSSYYYTYTLLNEGQQDFYNLEWEGDNALIHIVTVDDAMPASVPIPTAVLLFGSGLVGLAGFKRKMDN